MFGIRTFLVGLLAGACGGLFAANYHVVRTVDGVVVVPRTQRPPLRSSYVDVRTWSQAMWSNHPEVTEALTADGRQDSVLKTSVWSFFRPLIFIAGVSVTVPVPHSEASFQQKTVSNFPPLFH